MSLPPIRDESDRLQQQTHSWGWSLFLHADRGTVLAEAHGTAGGASSLHVHRGKANAFVCVEGSIEVWSANGLIAQLTEGDCCCVPAGVPHRMVWLHSGVVLELYYALPNLAIDLKDIDRLEPGWKPGEKSVVSRKGEPNRPGAH